MKVYRKITSYRTECKLTALGLTPERAGWFMDNAVESCTPASNWAETASLEGPGGEWITLRHHDSGKFTLTVIPPVPPRPEFYVFRMAKDAKGVLPVWVEYFSASKKLHTVLPTLFATRGDAMQEFASMYPSAFVDKVLKYKTGDRDLRALRVYAKLFAGQQIPPDFPWEEFEDL